MGSIKLLAVDLDDTLLRSDLSISFRTRHVLRKAEAAGLTVVLASGRTPGALDRFVRLLGLKRRGGYLVCENGSLILESHTGKCLFQAVIPPKPALTAFDLAAAEGFSMQIYEDDVIYISRPNEFADYDQKLTGLRQVVVENFRDMVAQGCYKLLIPGDPLILEPLERLLQVYLGEELTIFTSKPYFLELLPPQVDKGRALQMIAETLKIPREEVMAVGDSMNDEAMLRWAGTGVAMINGDPRVKDIASLVTTRSNDDDGVADVIERYILRSPAEK